MKERTVLLGLLVPLAILTSQILSAGAVSAGNGCHRDIPVFTTDAAPSDGVLMFRVQLGGEDRRTDTTILKTWDVIAGQQINNDIVTNVPAPRWARLWWKPDDDDFWYLLPSQYWHSDGTTASLYGVSCKPAAQPSYHTSFSLAIPENQLPLEACSTTPILIDPPDGAVLNTLVPLFEWDHGHEPGAIELRLETAKDPSFVRPDFTYTESFLLSRELRFPWNLEASTTYYWRVVFVCRQAARVPHEVRTFVTGSGGVILPAPSLIAPSDASIVSSGTVLLQWEAVDGAVEYLLEWGEDDQGTQHSEWTSDTQYQIDYGLRPDTTYEWSVAARNDYAIGQFATWKFTTSASP